MPVIEPNSPEALKLANRVRSTYYLVAALNFVVIAVIAINVWPQSSTAQQPAKTDPAKTEPAKPAGTETDEAKDEGEKKDAERPRGRRSSKPVVVAKTPEEKAAVAEMESLNEKVLLGYSAGDLAKFSQDFSPTAVPKPDEHYFKKVVVDLYQAEFGDVVSKKYLAETKALPDYGMLVYECVTKKRPKAKLSVNFRREAGALKIVQWRMEKM